MQVQFSLFLIIAVLSSGALGMNLRSKRQAQAASPTTPQTPQVTQATQATTSDDAALRACIQSCPVTPEYNPVCGSNSQTYDNPGRLLCAQACGVNVTLFRQSRCSRTAN